MKLATLSEAEAAIKNRRPFELRSGNLRAITGWNGGRGNLPSGYHDSLINAIYVVYSYATPIAWVQPDGTALVPDVGYSATTSQHQYLAAHALGIDFRPARGRELRPSGGGPRRGGVDG